MGTVSQTDTHTDTEGKFNVYNQPNVQDFGLETEPTQALGDPELQPEVDIL